MSNWAQHDLWVANYVDHPENATPALPSDWHQWKFWQYGEHGQVPGISGDVDLNWFNGSADDFARYTTSAGGGTQPPPTTKGAHIAVDHRRFTFGIRPP